MSKKIIYADDAIEALAKELKGVFVEYRDMAEKLIGKLPSAQPETHEERTKTHDWIPVTERLPEEDVEVLITYRYKEGEGDTSHAYIDITTYGQMYFGGNKVGDHKHWRQPFEYFTSNYEVVAWMPLPDPWKGERKMSECMTQEDAMNMSNEQAVAILKPLMNMMRDQNGCPISDAYFALDKAITALSQPQRMRGRWTKAYDGYDGHVKCTQCFKTYDWDAQAQYYNFCPNCGADMRGEQDG